MLHNIQRTLLGVLLTALLLAFGVNGLHPLAAHVTTATSAPTAAATASLNLPSGEIAYTSKGGIYVINADGSNAHLLIHNLPGSYFDYSAWSPNGKQIAITALANDQQTPSQIYIANADGSNLKSLTHEAGRAAILLGRLMANL